MKGHKKLIGVLILSLFSMAAHPQKLIRGFVIDSASFIPLSYVNIRVKNSILGTSSDTKGGFSIATSRGDTLVFSLVGYNSEEFAVDELEETIIIRMAVQIKELQAVTIVARKEKQVRPVHMTPKLDGVNYGPYGPGFNLGYFSKYEREKRKLVKVKAAHDLVKNYIAVVCDPDIKDRICKEYSLTNDQYFELLAKFNIQNMNRTYDLTSAEWVTVLRKFYADNVYRR